MERESQEGGEMRAVKVSWRVTGTQEEGRGRGVPRKQTEASRRHPNMAVHGLEEMPSMQSLKQRAQGSA